MPLADLLDILRREADARATELVAAARQDAERLVVEAENRLARQLADVIRVREAELRARAAAEIEAARQAATREVLTARADMLAKVFSRARALVDQRALDPRLAPYWAEAESNARSYIASGDVVVGRPPEVAGVRVDAADGSIGIDGTAAALLSRLEPTLAIEVVRELEASA